MSKQLEERKQELCLSCMECCKTLAFSIPKKAMDKHTEKFYKERGCQLKKDGKIIWVVISSVCPNLSSFGCKVYEQRPFVCRIFDGRKLSFMRDVCKWYELNG